MIDLPTSDEPEQDLAAELALDLLTGPEKAHALRLQLADPSFAQDIEAWRTRLAPLYAEFEEMTVPETVWNAVLARLGASPVADESRFAAPRIKAWKTIAIAASALAACLAILLVASLGEAPKPPSVGHSLAIASLTGETRSQTVTIAYDPRDGTLLVSSAGIETGQKVPELWVIPADGKPRSLGYIKTVGTSRLKLVGTHGTSMVAGTMLAITMEDSTIPHDAPGSKPILTGKISFP